MALQGNFLLPRRASETSLGRRFKAQWQQTMLRVSNLDESIQFFEKHFGMRLVHKYDFGKYGFELAFLHSPRKDTKIPSDGAEDYLWTSEDVFLELTYNHPSSESGEVEKYVSGNDEPHRGFGHIAFNCNDVYKVCEELEKGGVLFKKRPDEGRMKGIAFVYTPDGYWIEICSRAHPERFSLPQEKFNFSQTMIRVRDPRSSISFYRDIFGMALVRVIHGSDFSLYFLITPSAQDGQASGGHDDEYDLTSEKARETMKDMWGPVLELTHNHGTEITPRDVKVYSSGNEPNARGFGHIGFIVNDVQQFCSELDKATFWVSKKQDGDEKEQEFSLEGGEREKVTWQKRLDEGSMKDIAFVKDPDGYWVEIIQRGTKFDEKK